MKFIALNRPIYSRSIAFPALEISSYPIAIICVFLAVMLLQIVFFTEYLAVEQSYGRGQINQKNPIREYQELAKQDEPECDVDGVAAKSKNAGRDEFVGMV